MKFSIRDKWSLCGRLQKVVCCEGWSPRKIQLLLLIHLDELVHQAVIYYRVKYTVYSHLCVVPENIHTPAQRVIGNSEGEGVLRAKIFKGQYEPKL